MKTECYFKVDDLDKLESELEIRQRYISKDIYFDNRKNEDESSYVIVRIFNDKIQFVCSNIDDDLYTALNSYITTNETKDIKDVVQYLKACYFECLGVLEYQTAEAGYHIIDSFDISLELSLINDVYKFVRVSIEFDEINQKTADLCMSSLSKKLNFDQKMDFNIKLVKLLLKPFELGDNNEE